MDTLENASDVKIACFVLSDMAALRRWVITGVKATMSLAFMLAAVETRAPYVVLHPPEITKVCQQ